MKRLALVLAFCLGFCLFGPLHGARAQDDDSGNEIELPGLQSDAEALAAMLGKAFPAGATDDQKSQASDAANAALQANDMAAALPALEKFVGAEGDSASWQSWLSLAQAELAVTPPRPQRALQAGWIAFTKIDQSSNTAAQDQVSALTVMDQALQALKLPVPELQVLQAIARREPDNQAAQQAAVLAQQKVGIAFRHLATDAEAFPTRACIRFYGNPSSAPDFHPGDWVKFAPAVPDAAVTLESHRICITGLPPGALTKLTLLHGMPGDDGIALHQDLVVPVAMPDRQPRLIFDNGRFIQPRGALATVGLGVVNLSAVKLAVVRIAERNLLHVMQTYPPGQLLDSYAGTDLAQNQGTVVWSGSAAGERLHPQCAGACRSAAASRHGAARPLRFDRGTGRWHALRRWQRARRGADGAAHRSRAHRLAWGGRRYRPDPQLCQRPAGGGGER